MASPPTSRLRFLSSSGSSLPSPQEWQPALIQVDAPGYSLRSIRLEQHGEQLPISLRVLAGEERVLVDWPRSGPGSYELRLLLDGAEIEVHRLGIKPMKITPVAFARLLEDLESQLPAAIALSLQRLGGLAGLKLGPPSVSTRAQEFQRLGRAVRGHDGRPGLAQTLRDIATNPHRILRSAEVVVPAERVRRPVASRLLQTVAAGRHLSPSGLPTSLIDSQAYASYDVYENRLVNTFYEAVARRLSRLARIVSPVAGLPEPATDNGSQDDVLLEIVSLKKQLSRARSQATFLDEVNELTGTPDNISMVLLNRAPYRAALEGYYEFFRSIWVRLEEPALAAPLQNLPYLYELWGTLQVLSALADIAAEQGYVQLGDQQTIVRDADGFFVRVVPNGRPIIELRHPEHQTHVRLIPQRTFGTSGELRSTTFQQVPDVTLEVRRPNALPQLFLFDPKYKLDSQQFEEAADAGPKKEDIDKMHAYRDAIRGPNQQRVVEFAGILYPGNSKSFSTSDGGSPEIAAICADPERPELLHEMIGPIIRGALQHC
jgi:predicted component of viral defense system (DUF524 family)